MIQPLLTRISVSVRRHIWPIVFLSAITAFLFVANLRLGTWLIGWDSYTPNLHFTANFERNFFGVWQESRGLGLPDGMSHIANFLHTLVIWLLAFIAPENQLRYIYHLGCLWVGGLGLYVITHFLSRKRIAPTLAALFYMFNFATLQMFHLPLEVFSVHFAALPWLSWSLLKYFEKPSAFKLFLFAVLTFVFTPQSYVPTIFAVYLFSFLITVFTQFRTPQFLKKAIVVTLILCLVNAFWAVPYAFNMTKNLQVIGNGKINHLSNETILLNNQEYGDFSSTALFQGLYLSFLNSKNTQITPFIMQPWINHWKSPIVQGIGWSFFALIVLGIVGILLQRKWRYVPFLFMWIFAFLILGNDIPGLSFFFFFLSKYVPVFSSAFRFVFTKYSLLYVFSSAVLFSVAMEFLIGKKKVWQLIVTTLFCGALFYYALPSFQGHFFYNKLQVKIPAEYFELIEFFNNRPVSERVDIMPHADLWGWTYNTWGFVGSGFIWQGIQQPTMDGAFYPWLPENENYYLEFTTALQSKNTETIKNILEKYHIDWLVIDESVKTEEVGAGSHHIQELEKVLDETGVNLEKQMGSLKIYHVSQPQQSQFFLSKEKLTQVQEQDSRYLRFDSIFNLFKSYISSQKNNVHLPFHTLSSDRQLKNIAVIPQSPFHTLDVTAKVSPTDDVLKINTQKDQRYLLPTVVKKEGNTIVVQVFYPMTIHTSDAEELFSPEIYEFNLRPNREFGIYQVFVSSNVFELKESNDFTDQQLVSVTKDQVFPLYIDAFKDAQSAPIILHEKEMVSKDIWEKIDQIESTSYPLPNRASSLKVTFSTLELAANLLSPDITYNCDPLNRGTFHRTAVENGVLYEARDRASICENFGFGGIDTKLGYILHIKGESLSDKGLNFNVYNWTTRRNDMEEILPTGKFDQFISLLPKQNVEGSGESVNLETKSFLRKTTKNKLETLSFYPLNINLAQDITIEPKQESIISDSATVTLKNVQKKGSFSYLLHVENDNEQGNVIFLQAFDDHWIAFPKNSPTQLFEHVKYNGWANAWLLPQGEYEVVILYWPQLLSFAGYAILVFTFIGFGMIFLKSKKK